MFRRKQKQKQQQPDHDQPAATIDAVETVLSRPPGEPTAVSGRVRPDESVLDELSRAFRSSDNVESDVTGSRSSGIGDDEPDAPSGDNAALIADDDTAPADVDPFGEVTEVVAATDMGDDAAGDAHDDAAGDTRDDAAGDMHDDTGSGDPDRLPVEFDDADAGPIELQIVTAEDYSPDVAAHVAQRGAPTPPGERRTIRIGDEFNTGSLDAVTVAEARGRNLSLDIGAGNATASDGRVARPVPPGIDRADRAADETDSIEPARGASGRATIAISGRDELPDAVYLDDGSITGGDGATGMGDESGGTVFIDDDGTGDAIAAKDVATPGIEPRIRQRRIGVRRAESRRRIKWVVLGLAVLIVVLGILTVLGSGLFAIDDIDVTGDIYTDQTELTAVIEDLRGTAALRADTEAFEQRLEAIPWVEDARVRAHFPDRATIEIRERTPIATMQGADGRFRVLDDTGRVLDVLDGQPVAFVLLGVPTPLDLAAGEFEQIGPASAASLVTKLPPTIRPRVLSIDVTADGSDLVMYLSPEAVLVDATAEPATGDPATGEPAEGVPAEGQPASGDTPVQDDANATPAAAGGQTTPIAVRFGSALGDNDQIEKLVRLQRQLDDLPDRTITEINVATNEVTVL